MLPSCHKIKLYCKFCTVKPITHGSTFYVDSAIEETVDPNLFAERRPRAFVAVEISDAILPLNFERVTKIYCRGNNLNLFGAQVKFILITIPISVWQVSSVGIKGRPMVHEAIETTGLVAVIWFST